MLVFGYFYVYRKFLMPKTVFMSHSYVQACDYIKSNNIVRQLLGKDIHVMMCNGKQYPYKNDFNFELILFGTSHNAKAKVHVQYNKDEKIWLLDSIDVVTRNSHLKLL